MSANRQDRGRRTTVRWPAGVEALEGRVLLSGVAAAAVVESSAAGAPAPAAGGRATPKAQLLRRAGSALAGVSAQFAEFRARGRPGGTFRPSDPQLSVAGEKVAVEVFAKPGQASAVASRLKAAGMTNVQRHGSALSGRLPLAAVEQLGTMSGVRSVRPVRLIRRAGAVTSQGDAAERANLARAAVPATGAGVKVGILSDSFNTSSSPIKYADDVASGDLPSGVQVLADSAGGTDEGRAMAQLVYDSAPGVSLAFATADGGQAAFAANIRALRNAGASVIVDDIGYLDEPFFQDGVVAQAVDAVVASGASYFSAAGNEGRNAYESAFRPALVRPEGTLPSAAGAPTFGGGTSHDFDPGPGIDDLQAFSLQPGQSILLSFQWDQPYRSASASGSGPGSASDIDIYVLDAAGTRVLGGSTDDNTAATGTGDPVEVFQFSNTGTRAANYNLMIVDYGGPQPGRLKYVNFADQTFAEYNTNSGTIFGHPNAAGAAGVGAAAYFQTPAFGTSPPQVEYYSSAGTTPILFAPSGARLATPQVRQAPRFVAPDGGNTTFFGQQIADGDTRPNFFGTSAAAPAAAAGAALLVSADPTLTPAGVYAALQNTAVDMDDPSTAAFDPGYDAVSGSGLIQVDRAIATLLPTVQAVVVNDGSPQRSRVTSLSVTFSRQVTVAADGFRLARRDGLAADVTASPAADGRTFVLTFGGAATEFGSLNDGIYDLTVVASAVRGAASPSTLTMPQDATASLHRLFGDADGDRDVDGADSRGFRTALGSTPGDPAYNPVFDFDADGDVDGADSRQFRNRLGTSI